MTYTLATVWIRLYLGYDRNDALESDPCEDGLVGPYIGQDVGHLCDIHVSVSLKPILFPQCWKETCSFPSLEGQIIVFLAIVHLI